MFLHYANDVQNIEPIFEFLYYFTVHYTTVLNKHLEIEMLHMVQK